jgi:hypothetical protein
VGSPSFSRLVLVRLAVVACALGAGGCASFRNNLVKPHQRAYLSDRIMRVDNEKLSRGADQHVLSTREGAFGGTGTAGGGCGCN